MKKLNYNFVVIVVILLLNAFGYVFYGNDMQILEIVRSSTIFFAIIAIIVSMISGEYKNKEK